MHEAEGDHGEHERRIEEEHGDDGDAPRNDADHERARLRLNTFSS